MPAPSIFLNSAEIAAVMGFSLRSAQNMIAMFAMRGQTVKSGKSSRGQLVSVTAFVRYLCEQDGEDPAQRKREVMDCLKEIRGGHTRKDIRKGAAT